MTDEERHELLADLNAGTEALLQAIDGVTDDDARRVLTADGWCILGCVEHVARVEDYLFMRLLQAVDGESTANPVREHRIRSRGADRRRRVQAPEGVIPDGRYPTLEDALAAYRSSRAETVRYLERVAGDLRAKITTHPVIGEVNCYEMLLIMAAHPRRHADQIAEIRRAISGSAPSPSC